MVSVMCSLTTVLVVVVGVPASLSNVIASLTIFSLVIALGSDSDSGSETG